MKKLTLKSLAPRALSIKTTPLFKKAGKKPAPFHMARSSKMMPKKMKML